MILNIEQIQKIQQKISFAVKYQETYNEVYDHVLSAIDNASETNIDAVVLADKIVEQDLGGYQALGKAEDDHVKQVTRAMRKKHWHNIVEFFNIPLIGFTLLITIASGYLVSDPADRRYLLIFAFSSSITPLLFIFYGKISAKYLEWKYGIYKKSSLKDNYIFIAAILGESMFNLLNMGINKIVMNAGITLFIFIFYVIYVLSFFKLYMAEFKMNLAR